MRSLDEFYKYIEKQERALREQGPVQEQSFETGPENEPVSDEALQRAVEEAELAGQRPPVPVVHHVSPLDAPENPRPVNVSIEPPSIRPPGRVRYVMRGGVTISVPIEDEDEPQQAAPVESRPAARVQPRPAATVETRQALPAEPRQATPAEPRPSATVVTERRHQGSADSDAPVRPRTVHRAPVEEEPLPVPAALASGPAMSDGEAAELWGRLPRHIQLLVGMADSEEEVAQKYYRRGFKETRHQLVERLLDPTLTLEDTARILGVCPTTVRRYTNRGQLSHHRTVGQQRRFRLSDVLSFLEKQAGQTPGSEAQDTEDAPG